jgi:acyl-coenzyme A synthetase/AMP-(fatty) acid ligase
MIKVGAEDPLFVLYTSGSTGKPKVRGEQGGGTGRVRGG